MENNVTTRKEGGLPSTALYEGDAHAGFENVKTSSLALPILKLLQNGSGEAQKRNQNYVEGAEPGMIFNTVTKQTYDGEKGLYVIPCGHKRDYVEWTERGEGSSAPVATHSASSGIIKQATRDGANKERLPNGNYLENTASYFVIAED